MSTNNTVLNTGQQATTNFDLSKIFIWNNRYENATYINSGYTPATIPAGTVMGRIGATQNVVPLVSTASDGSQYPVGILACDLNAIAAGATQACTICVSGDVSQDKLVLQGADTLSTIVSSRSIFDRIGSDTIGVKITANTEMTQNDNQ
jgi:hypothetical protein